MTLTSLVPNQQICTELSSGPLSMTLPGQDGMLLCGPQTTSPTEKCFGSSFKTGDFSDSSETQCIYRITYSPFRCHRHLPSSSLGSQLSLSNSSAFRFRFRPEEEDEVPALLPLVSRESFNTTLVLT